MDIFFEKSFSAYLTPSGSSDARQNPLHFIITTEGTDRHSIAYELHTKAVDILEGRRVDPTFYPVVYGLNAYCVSQRTFLRSKTTA